MWLLKNWIAEQHGKRFTWLSKMEVLTWNNTWLGVFSKPSFNIRSLLLLSDEGSGHSANGFEAPAPILTQRQWGWWEGGRIAGRKGLDWNCCPEMKWYLRFCFLVQASKNCCLSSITVHGGLGADMTALAARGFSVRKDGLTQHILFVEVEAFLVDTGIQTLSKKT